MDYNFFILVTNYENSGEDVLWHTRELRADTLEKALKVKNQVYEECYEIPEKELSFYLYDPLFASDNLERTVMETAKKYQK